jgi:hypothetical protein
MDRIKHVCRIITPSDISSENPKNIKYETHNFLPPVFPTHVFFNLILFTLNIIIFCTTMKEEDIDEIMKQVHCKV